MTKPAYSLPQFRFNQPGVPASKSAAVRDDVISRTLRMMTDPSGSIPADLYRLVERPSQEQLGGATAYSVVLPWQALARDLTTSTADGTAKGGLLGAGVPTSPVQESLRGFSLASGLCTFLEAGGSVTRRVPVVSGAPVAEWVQEQGAPTTPDGGAHFSASILTARTLACTVTVRRHLHQKTDSPGIETLMRSELLKAIGRSLDAALLDGDGLLEPLGILQTTGVQTQAGATIGRAGLVAMLKKLTAAGVSRDRISFVTDPATAETLQTRQVATGEGVFLMSDDDRLVGRPVFVSPEAPAGTLLCGDFAGAIVASWGGLELTTNPYKFSITGSREIHVRATVGIVVPRPTMFVVATSVS